MDEEFLAAIQRAIMNGNYKVTEHAIEEAEKDLLLLLDVKEAVLSGELIEDYPEDRRGHSCLILGYFEGRAVHAVCGMRSQKAIVITVYCPDPKEWINDRQRRK
jgi:hypothetical protein